MSSIEYTMGFAATVVLEYHVDWHANIEARTMKAELKRNILKVE